MLSTLIKAAATAAVSAVVYRAFREGRFDPLIDRLTTSRAGAAQKPLSLNDAYAPGNISRPAPAAPWPVDPLALPATRNPATD
jgi:hypothetical protein